MAARFHCDATFTIPSRRTFVLAGQIVEGAICAGMWITLPTPDGTALGQPINSIELISTPDRRGAVGLCIAFADSRHAEALQALAIRDVDCSVAEEPLTVGRSGPGPPRRFLC